MAPEWRGFVRGTTIGLGALTGAFIVAGLDHDWWILLLGYLYCGFLGILIWRRRHRRSRRGLCLNCGYSLTGNVSDACPECGAEVKQQ